MLSFRKETISSRRWPPHMCCRDRGAQAPLKHTKGTAPSLERSWKGDTAGESFVGFFCAFQVGNTSRPRKQSERSLMRPNRWRCVHLDCGKALTETSPRRADGQPAEGRRGLGEKGEGVEQRKKEGLPDPDNHSL